jgi:hypothetical protein
MTGITVKGTPIETGLATSHRALRTNALQVTSLHDSVSTYLGIAYLQAVEYMSSSGFTFVRMLRWAGGPHLDYSS